MQCLRGIPGSLSLCLELCPWTACVLGCLGALGGHPEPPGCCLHWRPHIQWEERISQDPVARSQDGTRPQVCTVTRDPLSHPRENRILNKAGGTERKNRQIQILIGDMNIPLTKRRNNWTESQQVRDKLLAPRANWGASVSAPMRPGSSRGPHTPLTHLGNLHPGSPCPVLRRTEDMQTIIVL